MTRPGSPPKAADVVAHPLQRADQVQGPEVARPLVGIGRGGSQRGVPEPAEHAETVVGGDDDHALRRGERAAPVGRGLAGDIGTAMYPEHDRQTRVVPLERSAPETAGTRCSGTGSLRCRPMRRAWRWPPCRRGCAARRRRTVGACTRSAAIALQGWLRLGATAARRRAALAYGNSEPHVLAVRPGEAEHALWPSWVDRRSACAACGQGLAHSCRPC